MEGYVLFLLLQMFRHLSKTLTHDLTFKLALLNKTINFLQVSFLTVLASVELSFWIILWTFAAGCGHLQQVLEKRVFQWKHTVAVYCNLWTGGLNLVEHLTLCTIYIFEVFSKLLDIQNLFNVLCSCFLDAKV